MKIYKLLKICRAYSEITIRSLYSFAADQVATNKTERVSIPENYFGPEDNNPDSYRRKIWNLYFDDIKNAHFDRYYTKSIKEGKTPEEARQIALEKVKEITTKQADKMLNSHKEFISKLREMGIVDGQKVVSPGSGMGHEQAIDPKLQWHGLEYQKNLVDLSNQRNKQTGNNSRSDVWSFIKSDPDSPLGEQWEDKINVIKDITGMPEAIYAKHACGGITDGAMFRAVKDKIPKIFLATCCANRYTEISWRVLSPTDSNGKKLSFDEYKKIADNTKRNDESGKKYVDIVDGFRQEFLERNGYTVERGVTSHGPYIKAWLY